MILTTIQLIATVIYVTVVVKKFGILSSISASTYAWKGQQRWYFLAWLWTLAILNLFQGMGGWGFLTSAGLAFSGITIDHESSGAHTDIVHIVGTVVAIVGVFLGLLLIHSMWIPLLLFTLIGTALFFVPNKIWWIEVTAFIIAFVFYYLR